MIDERAAFVVMDGNYANKLSLIVINESLTLNSGKDILTVQTLNASKSSVRAAVYEFVNWGVVKSKFCSFDIYYVKSSTADAKNEDEDASYDIKL